MRKALDETNRRRAIREAYNEEHGITPESIIRPLDMTLVAIAAKRFETRRRPKWGERRRSFPLQKEGGLLRVEVSTQQARTRISSAVCGWPDRLTESQLAGQVVCSPRKTLP
jgi:excinuclease UvrABC helicase subunit UvrB